MGKILNYFDRQFDDLSSMKCNSSKIDTSSPTTENESAWSKIANEVVFGDRQKEYGTPKSNHDRTAKLFSVYLGVQVTPDMVCMLNILQKVSRSIGARHTKDDTFIDIIGYVMCIEEMRK